LLRWLRNLPGSGRQVSDISALADPYTGVPIVRTHKRKTAGRSQPFPSINYLPVSAAATTVAAAEPATTTVEPTTAAEAATAVVTTTARAIAVIATCCAARETACATGGSARPGIANAAAIPNPTAIAYSTVSTATIVPATAVVTAASIVPAIPRSGADKDAAQEPARPVITIGGASIRRIRVVAPRADRSAVAITVVAIAVAAAHSDTDPDLGVRRWSRHQR